MPNLDHRGYVMAIQFGGSGKTGSKHQAAKASILGEVANALMGNNLPGAFSVPLPATLGRGTLNFHPIISKKDGRVMYNMSAKDVFIGKEQVKLTGGGNLFLPKDGYTVDAETFRLYRAANEGIENEKKARGGVPVEQTEEELEGGESVT